MIAALLTALLRKNSFKWNEVAGKTFDSLKLVVTHPPVLRLLDFFYFFIFIFFKSFTIECDASGVGIGVVLM